MSTSRITVATTVVVASVIVANVLFRASVEDAAIAVTQAGTVASAQAQQSPPAAAIAVTQAGPVASVVATATGRASIAVTAAQPTASLMATATDNGAIASTPAGPIAAAVAVFGNPAAIASTPSGPVASIVATQTSWSPTTVAQGCVLWLENPTSGSASSWADASASSNTFLSANSANNAVYRATGANGLPALQGNGTVSCLNVTGGNKLFNGTSAERHMVMIADTTTSLPTLGGWGVSSGLGSDYIALSGSFYDEFCSTVRFNWTQSLTGRLFIYSTRSGGGNFTAYINGVQVHQAANTFQVDQFARLFGSFNGAAYSGGNALIAEVIAYNGITGTSDFNTTISYLTAKFSIT